MKRSQLTVQISFILQFNMYLSVSISISSLFLFDFGLIHLLQCNNTKKAGVHSAKRLFVLENYIKKQN